MPGLVGTAQLALVTHSAFGADARLRDGDSAADARSAARHRLISAALEGALAGAGDALRLEPRAATRAQVETVHDPEYLDIVQAYSAGFLRRSTNDRWLGPTVPVYSDTYDLAMLAAGSVVEAIDAVERGLARRALVAARPGSHQAYGDRGEGFCVMNHTAVGARHWQQAHGREHVAIIDVDVHHGSGTEAIFLNDPTVATFSIHGGGGVTINRGAARSVRVAAGTRDGTYLRALEQGLRTIPVRPEAVLLVMGFDTHADDPLGNLRLTEAAYPAITQVVLEYADRHCGGRLVSVIAGGYNAATIGDLVATHAAALAA